MPSMPGRDQARAHAVDIAITTLERASFQDRLLLGSGRSQKERH